MVGKKTDCDGNESVEVVNGSNRDKEGNEDSDDSEDKLVLEDILTRCFSFSDIFII
jgi:hypothetical protein